MATVVEQFEKRHRGRPPKYNWDKYMDGQIWILHEGSDFDCPGGAKSFRALVHRTATSRGLKAETRIINKTAVQFCVHDSEES